MAQQQKNSYVLLGVIQSYAPNGETQEMVAKNYRLMCGSNMTEDQIVTALAGVITNGLTYGNWPWTGHTAKV